MYISGDTVGLPLPWVLRRAGPAPPMADWRLSRLIAALNGAGPVIVINTRDADCQLSGQVIASFTFSQSVRWAMCLYEVLTLSSAKGGVMVDPAVRHVTTGAAGITHLSLSNQAQHNNRFPNRRGSQ